MTALPFLFVYKLNLCTSQPHFQGQKSDFSSFLVKEVKFRQIEISQKVNLLFPHRTMYEKMSALQSKDTIEISSSSFVLSHLNFIISNFFVDKECAEK